MELPSDIQIKQVLLVHGIHIGGTIRLMQHFNSQGLALIMQNGRKIALRKPDCADIKVVRVDE